MIKFTCIRLYIKGEIFMRYSRQNKIIELINTYEIDTQEKLASLLRESGFEVTQATISRDIKDLQLVKTLTSGGKCLKSIQRYAGFRPLC